MNWILFTLTYINIWELVIQFAVKISFNTDSIVVNLFICIIIHIVYLCRPVEHSVRASSLQTLMVLLCANKLVDRARCKLFTSYWQTNWVNSRYNEALGIFLWYKRSFIIIEIIRLNNATYKPKYTSNLIWSGYTYNGSSL